MNFHKKISLLALAITLTACSHFSSSAIGNRDNSYLDAKNIPPLRVPPGVATNDFHNYYPVSDRTDANSAKKVSIVPPGLMSN